MDSMKTVSLNNLPSTTAGRIVANYFSDLSEGNYALIPDKKTGKAMVYERTPSNGTHFYKSLSKATTLSFERLRRVNVLPFRVVELNASPVGSDSQEYADALIFSV